MSELKTSISVKYKSADGWHVFASDELPGLYVASQQAKVAFDDVCPAIEKLLHLNQGIKVKAEPELTFTQFLRMVNATKQGKTEKIERPFVLSDQRFILYAQ